MASPAHHCDLPVPGSNALQTAVEGVRKLMSRMKERFPEDVDYAISLDQTLPVPEGMERRCRNAG